MCVDSACCVLFVFWRGYCGNDDAHVRFAFLLLLCVVLCVCVCVMSFLFFYIDNDDDVTFFNQSSQKFKISRKIPKDEKKKSREYHGKNWR